MDDAIVQKFEAEPTSDDSGQSSTPSCGCGKAKACSCGAAARAPETVYALGELGVDFGGEARRESIWQHAGSNQRDASHLLAYLDKNPWDASAVIWTLNLEGVPIYAINPVGPFAGEGYERLRRFFSEQSAGKIERVSIAGMIAGSATLLNDVEVPLVWPELRCMNSWRIDSLVEAAAGPPPDKSASEDERSSYANKTRGLRNFVERVHYELRNQGRSSMERAINYAATNAFNAAKIFQAAVTDDMELESIDAEVSPVARTGSDCWDVKLTFFNPSKMFEQARKVHRFTVDVSDVCPVMVGKLRSWSVR